MQLLQSLQGKKDIDIIIIQGEKQGAKAGFQHNTPLLLLLSGLNIQKTWLKKINLI